jgi:acetyl-CoA C-acetyltransferase
MGLRGDAVIAGIAEHAPERKYRGERRFTLEQWADLAAMALDDAGLTSQDVNGLCCANLRESEMFVPSTVAEYLGWHVNFAERVDLGGATPIGMVWRAAAAIELGLCDVVVCAAPSRPTPSLAATMPRTWSPFGASSNITGSPQAEFDIPYGNLAQNGGYAMIANRYAAEYGYDPRATAKIAAEQRANACANPAAVFRDDPITIDDVLGSKMVADPLHLLEIVMPCAGGAAVVVTSADVARRAGKHRPVHIAGFGEHLAYKTPTYAADLLRTPIGPAADGAFAMAGVQRSDIDAVQLYDCYTITVLLSIEDSGFCAKGEGMGFVRDNDLTFAGSFPLNTHGGQLGFGQAGMAGGFSQVTEAVRQVRGEADGRQVRVRHGVLLGHRRDHVGADRTDRPGRLRHGRGAAPSRPDRGDPTVLGRPGRRRGAAAALQGVRLVGVLSPSALLDVPVRRPRLAHGVRTRNCLQLHRRPPGHPPRVRRRGPPTARHRRTGRGRAVDHDHGRSRA